MKLARATSGLLLLSSFLPFPAVSMPAPGSASEDAAAKTQHEIAKGDPLLEALLTELDRSKDHLKMDQVGAPYYVEYRVDDVDNFDAEAAFGALRLSERERLRVLRVVVRIGDYKQDSYYNQGIGGATVIPVDNDPIAIRRQIWLLTDEAYKAAADALAEKQATLKQFAADANPIDDFAKAPVVTKVEPVVALKIDEKDWGKTLQDMTAEYKGYPEVQSVSASVRMTSVNRYFVNSEGTILRTGRQTATLSINGSTQAEDGMRLQRSPFWTEERPEDLPSRTELMKHTTETLETLKALRNAPIVEESYRGPVWFAPDAADDVMAGLIGSNVLGRRPPLGRPNRTTGAFATGYKTRVLPKFVSIIDDPTLKEFSGKRLVGSYEFDAEGVAAAPVKVVEDGTLQSYLMSRQPIRDFPFSNGHGRASIGAPAFPNVGVMIVKTSEPASTADIKKRLTDMAAEQNKPYGYRVDTLGPQNAPRLLYRVYADGHEELVRGAVFNELDVRALRNDLIAVGNDPLVSNRSGGLPETIISPSLLFDELEVKRADTSKDKLPEYPAPDLKK